MSSSGPRCRGRSTRVLLWEDENDGYRLEGRKAQGLDVAWSPLRGCDNDGSRCTRTERLAVALPQPLAARAV
ncbi:unnamed protein product [Lampetra planeri]